MIRRVAPSNVLEPIVDAPERVETVLRLGDEGQRFLFLLNYNADTVTIGLKELEGADLLTDKPASGDLCLEPNGVAVIALEN